MTDRQEYLESRIELLNQRLQSLEEKVNRILVAGEGLPITAVSSPLPTAENPEAPGIEGQQIAITAESEEATNKFIEWIEESVLFQRIAAICFLMVLALILRTVTDKQLINLELGSAIGIIYAVGVMFAGWIAYRRDSAIAPILTCCGMLLLFSMVVEAYGRFNWLSAVAAYGFFVITSIALSIQSLITRRALPAAAGLWCSGLCVVSMGFPDFDFPLLVITLLLLTSSAWSVATLSGCASVRWFLTLSMLFITVLWNAKLHALQIDGDPQLSPERFLPLISLVAVFNFAAPLYALLSKRFTRISVLAWLLMPLNVVWSYALLSNYESESRFFITIIAVTLGFIIWAVLFSYAKHELFISRAGSSLYLTAALLLLLWLPLLTQSLFTVIVFCGIILLGVIILASSETTAIVIFSYLFQFFCLIRVALELCLNKESHPTIVFIIVAGTAAILTFAQHAARKRLLKDGGFRIALFMFSLGYVYIMLIAVAFEIVKFLNMPPEVVYGAVSSIIISISAVALVLAAYLRRNSEVRMASVIVLAVNALKVFVFDFLTIGGVGRVTGVLAFGVAVAVHSLLLGRVKKRLPEYRQ